MFPAIELHARSEVPLYRQLFLRLKEMIGSGQLQQGQRLPATRELAGLLGLNRGTVTAAYELLEAEGLIQGHVGRGSFVCASGALAPLPWERILPPPESPPAPSFAPHPDLISFATSRPAQELFPLEELRELAGELLRRPEAQSLLQLGSPAGYPPLRRYLLEEARRQGAARSRDDILITSGCQQALDLLQRLLVGSGEAVLIEDPVYPGLKNLLTRAGAKVLGAPVGAEGIVVEEVARILERFRPRMVVVTPSFQNPTGATMPRAARLALLRLVRSAGAVLVENDIYSQLRYEGQPEPSLKELDASGDTVLIGSFSKIAFPGLRVGWVLGPAPLVARLAEAKQYCDLHTDQLSQALMLRFAESGLLETHRKRVCEAGAQSLRALTAAVDRHFPPGAAYLRPAGGMNLWVRLPQPLDAAVLLPRAEREGAVYLPGKYFEVSRCDPGALRLCFGGLAPDRIRAGVEILGRVFASEFERARRAEACEPAPAVV